MCFADLSASVFVEATPTSVLVNLLIQSLTIRRTSMKNLTVLIALLLPAVAAAQSLSPVPSRNIVVFNDFITSALALDNSLLVGGIFAKCAEYNSGGVGVDPVSGAILPSIHFKNQLIDIISDNADGWYAMAMNTPPYKVGSCLFHHIAPDGAIRKTIPLMVDSIGLVPSGISSMAAIGDTLYLGGYFSEINNVERRSIAALRISTGEILPFNPTADSTVQSLAVYGSDIIVAGRFATIAGQPRTALARLNRFTGELHDWPIMPTYLMNRNFNDYNNSYPKLVINKNVLYTKRGAINITTGEATSWKPVVATTAAGLIGTINDIAVSQGKIVVVGWFNRANGQPRNAIAIYDEATGELLPIAPNAHWIDAYDQLVPHLSTIHIGGSTIYVGGLIRHADSTPVDGLAAFDLSTGELKKNWKVNCLRPQPGYELASFVQYADNRVVFLGGPYGSIGLPLYERSGIVELSSAGDKVLDWNVEMKNLGGYVPDTTPQVHTMVATEDRIYVGGGFDSVAGELRTNVCAFDRSTRKLLPWALKVAGGYVDKMVVYDGTVYVAGRFDSINGKRQRFIGAVDAISGELRPIDLEIDSTITAMDARDGKLYISGSFKKVGGKDQYGFVVLDSKSGVTIAEGPTLPKEASVSTMLVTDSTVYLSGRRMGGEVTAIAHRSGGQTALAGYDRITGEVKWKPKYDIPTNVLATSIQLYRGRLFISGSTRFTNDGGIRYGNSSGLYFYDVATGREVKYITISSGTAVFAIRQDTVFAIGDFDYPFAWGGMRFFGRFDPEQSSGVGIAEKEGGSDLKVWPNPARSFIRVESNGGGGGHVRIINGVGQVVSEGAVGKNGILSVSHLASGQYLVQLGNTTSTLTITR